MTLTGGDWVRGGRGILHPTPQRGKGDTRTHTTGGKGDSHTHTTGGEGDTHTHTTGVGRGIPTPTLQGGRGIPTPTPQGSWQGPRASTYGSTYGRVHMSSQMSSEVSIRRAICHHYESTMVEPTPTHGHRHFPPHPLPSVFDSPAQRRQIPFSAFPRPRLPHAPRSVCGIRWGAGSAQRVTWRLVGYTPGLGQHLYPAPVPPRGYSSRVISGVQQPGQLGGTAAGSSPG